MKVTASSAGDGVRVCRTPEDLVRAKAQLRAVPQPIFVEEFIPEGRSLAIHFGIPRDPQQQPEFIGATQQIIGENGEFHGGIANDDVVVTPEIDTVFRTHIFPKIREMGWHGIAELDVIADDSGRFWVIDPNFRLAATTPHVAHRADGLVKQNMRSVYGYYNGDHDTLKQIATVGPNQVLHVISLYQEERTHVIGALLYDQPETLQENAHVLERAGVENFGGWDI